MAQQQRALPPLPAIGEELSAEFDLPPIGEEVVDPTVVETPDGRDPDAITEEGSPVFKSEAVVPETLEETGRAFYDFGKGFLQNVNPLPALQALYGEMQATEPTSSHPATRVGEKVVGGVVGMARKIGAAQGAEFEKAQKAYDEGRVSEAIGHTMAWLLPIIGPAAAQAGETIGEGNVAEGLGQMTGILTPFGAMAGRGLTAAQRAAGAQAKAAGRMGATIPGVTPTGAPPGLNIPAVAPPKLTPEDAAAVAHAQRADIPIDAATASGRKALQSVQATLKGTTGAPIAEAAIRETAEKLAAEGRRIAGDVNKVETDTLGTTAPGGAMSAEGAATGVRGALEDLVANYKTEQNTAYDAFRAIEAEPRAARTVEVDAPTTASVGGDQFALSPEMQAQVAAKQQVTMQMPVDLRVPKRAMEGLYKSLQANPYKTAEAAWLRGIMDGPDFMPASQADDILGSLKKIARDKGGVSKIAVSELHSAVDRAVALVGGDAAEALRAGRAATRAKAEVVDVLDQLTKGTNDEPVRLFQRLSQADDKAIVLLEKLQRLAPNEMPNVGRAMIQDLLEPIPGKDPLTQAARAVRDWEAIGPKTRQMLFPSTQRDIGTFLHLAKKLSENPNPSGTGHVAIMGAQLGVTLLHPVSGVTLFIAPAALAKLLYSPRGVKLLTQGARLAMSGSKVAQAQKSVNSAAIMNMVGGDVVPLAGAAGGAEPQQDAGLTPQQEFESAIADDAVDEPAVEP